jgi:aldehyde dehydrogenase (NAD+)
LNVVHGKGYKGAGQYLIEEAVRKVPKNEKMINFNRLAQHLSFTGSTEVGIWIAKKAGPYMSPSLELGGNNPMYIHKDADLDLAVSVAIASGFEDAGQRCTSLHNLIVHQDIADKFRDKFMEAVDQIIIGDSYNNDRPVITYGPMMNAKWAKSFMEHYEMAIKDGAKLLNGDMDTQSQIIAKNDKFVGDPTLGLYMMPTVWDVGKNHDAKIVWTEVFGPTVNLITVKDEDEAIRVGTRPALGLSSSIVTKDMAVAKKWQEQIETGIVYVNGRTIGAEAHLPFGGLKEAKGKESGVWVFDSYTNTKAVTVNLSGKLQEAQVGAAPPKIADKPVDYKNLLG